jgi:serine/threonine-protein kinase RsbW
MRTLLNQSFTLGEVTAVRHTVARLAAHCGLDGHRLDGFVLAVHESVINAVRHGGGHGTITLWAGDGLLRAETVDQGSGIPAGHLQGHRRPPGTSDTGRGIYLIRRLCDEVAFRTGPDGTAVQVAMRLPRHHGRARGPMIRVRVGVPGHARHFTA